MKQCLQNYLYKITSTKLIKYVLFLLVTTIFMTSCATMFTGTKDKITFNSTPSKATIYIDGIERCKTPCTIKVRRSLSEKSAELKLKGYEGRTFSLENSFNPISILNLGNILGWGIDALSGSLFKYHLKNYNFTLEKKSSNN